MKDQTVERLEKELVDILEKMGYPPKFGMAIASELGTEMTLRRMIGYASEKCR